MMKVVSRVAPNASRSWECGAFSGQAWFQLKYGYNNYSITALQSRNSFQLSLLWPYGAPHGEVLRSGSV